MPPLNDEPFPNPSATQAQQSHNAPFKSGSTGPGLTRLLGDRLQANVNSTIDTSKLQSSEIIGIYFSAHWCPPCQMFTPLLVTIYRAAQTMGKAFEIVFASHDKSVGEFNQYYAGMPWKAIPFADRTRVQILASMFRVVGIPSLVIVDKMGNVLQSSQVVQQMRMSAEGFLRRLPARGSGLSPSQSPPSQATPTTPIPPLDSAVAALTLDDVMDSYRDDNTLTREQRIAGLDVIRRLLTNIKNDPNNIKFRTVPKSSKNIAELTKHDIFVKMLKLAGFRENATSFVAPIQLPLPAAFNQLLEVVVVLLESLQVASPPPSKPASNDDQGSKPGEGWECSDGVCRKVQK